jgi:hypothetical protein
MGLGKETRRTRRSWMAPALGAMLLTGVPLAAQTAGSHAAEIQQLKEDMKKFEARLAALEAADKAAAEGPVAAAPAAGASATAAPPTGEGIGHEGMPGMEEPAKPVGQEPMGQDSMDHGAGAITIDIPHIPEMKIRGFGDVRGYLANQNLAVITNSPATLTPSTQGGNSTFALGIMDMFVTSKISPKFSYLSEMGYEADPGTNNIGVDLERAQVTFLPSDKFSLTAGRSHAILGYYNTAFHHGTWFQTTMDRPRFFEFEDSGGPLPIHNVGVSMMGKLPNEKLGLHLFGEVGNGKQTYSLAAGPTPANVLSDHTGKSTNMGAYIRPDRFSGLQAGFDWYQASLVPTQVPGAAPYYHQNIYVAHAVYIRPNFEFMAEDGEIRDLARGANKPQYTSGGYAQISRAFRSFRPFTRYAWMNPNFGDPNNAWAGRWVGPESGVRWDVNTFVALKAEYDHYDWRNFSDSSTGAQVLPILHKTVNRAGMQIAYTF